MELLTVVQDTYEIRGRGVVVIPGPLIDDFNGPAVLGVQLRRPDGLTIEASLQIRRHSNVIDPTELRWACVLWDASVIDVPIGTEIWTHSLPD
jgi:hypothetical protein